MMDGFDYFDGNHRENFCAGLILLCLDEESSFRQRFADLVRKRLDLPTSVQLRDWGREASLITEQRKLRSDLWLNFDAEFFLIEIKTHSNWDPDAVVQQVLDQSASQVRRQPIRGAALLAPSSLLRSIRSEQVRKLSWSEVLDLVDTIEQPSRILCLAQAQWRCNVEPDFGLASEALVSSESMQQLASQAGCLKAFLRAALVRLGGHPAFDALHTGRPDGQPHRGDGWAWFGVAVSGQLQGFGRVLLGVFTYVECPKDKESELGMWLEVYRWGSWSAPFSFMRFAPPDLTHKSLTKVLDEFLKDFNAKHRQK